MTTDIPALRALLAKATPGPWSANRPHHTADGEMEWEILGTPRDLCVCIKANYLDPEDAELIPALRNAAPALLDELERLRVQNNQMEAVISRHRASSYMDAVLNDDLTGSINRLTDENERLRAALCRVSHEDCDCFCPILDRCTAIAVEALKGEP